MAGEQTAARTARRQPTDTRERLLAAAVDLFAERGYDGVRVRDIADRACVTTGAIYYDAMTMMAQFGVIEAPTAA